MTRQSELPAVPADFLAAAQRQADQEQEPMVILYRHDETDWSFCRLSQWEENQAFGEPQFVCHIAPKTLDTDTFAGIREALNAVLLHLRMTDPRSEARHAMEGYVKAFDQEHPEARTAMLHSAGLDW